MKLTTILLIISSIVCYSSAYPGEFWLDISVQYTFYKKMIFNEKKKKSFKKKRIFINISKDCIRLMPGILKIQKMNKRRRKN